MITVHKMRPGGSELPRLFHDMCSLRIYLPELHDCHQHEPTIFFLRNAQGKVLAVSNADPFAMFKPLDDVIAVAESGIENVDTDVLTNEIHRLRDIADRLQAFHDMFIIAKDGGGVDYVAQAEDRYKTLTAYKRCYGV